MACCAPYKAKNNGSGSMQYLVVPVLTWLVEVYPKFNHSPMIEV